MISKVPKFRTDDEEAAFWDVHDATQFLNELDDDTGTVFVRPEAGIVELSKETWSLLTRVARRRRTTPARLLRRWLNEKLQEARPER